MAILASFSTMLTTTLLLFTLFIATFTNAAEENVLESRGLVAARFGRNKMVRGVNLGGWFILEAWMMPSVFTPEMIAANITDQWTLMEKSDASFSRSLLTKHWQTWITEDDFAQIAAAGLNTIRIPVPHWAFISTTGKEPYWAFAEQNYIKQAVLWAKQYNLDVILDLHTAPNSQNGYDNSGRAGPVNFANVSPKTNQKRVIAALTVMVKMFVNNSKYGGVVKAIELLNEPACYAINVDFMNNFHQTAYKAVRAAVAKKALVTPTVIIHDCFIQPLSRWSSVYNKSSKIFKDGTYAIDTHRYQAFEPVASQTNASADAHVQYACGLSNELSSAQQTLFPVVVGEWSLGIQENNLFTYNTTLEDGTIATMQNNEERNKFLRRYYEAQANTYEKAGGWVFWAWKTETYQTWSYQTALQQGWIPKDPAERVFSADGNNCPTTTMTSEVDFASNDDVQMASYNGTNSRRRSLMSERGNGKSKNKKSKSAVSTKVEQTIGIASHALSHSSAFMSTVANAIFSSPPNSTAEETATSSTATKRGLHGHKNLRSRRHSSVVAAFPDSLL